MTTINQSRSMRADAWLVFTCLIWGASFPLVKIALQDISPLFFLAIRFGLGTLFLLPVCFRKKSAFSREVFKRGGLIGVFLFVGMMMQTLGLQYTSASKSGFITGLAVIIVPLLVVLIEKRRPNQSVMIGVLFACIGIALLTQPQSGGINKGDVLTLIGAFGFSLEIILVEMLIRKDESFAIAWMMVFTTAVLAGIATLGLETVHLSLTPSVIIAIGFVSVFCTAFGFTMQALWQPRTTASAAALIFTAEPVFAAMFAWILLSETMGAMQWLGGGFILSGMLISEFRHQLSFNYKRKDA